MRRQAFDDTGRNSEVIQVVNPNIEFVLLAKPL
jgi:hypothetical protein